jgi:alkaline phosphatase
MSTRLMPSMLRVCAGALVLSLASGAHAQSGVQNVIVLIGNGLGPATTTAARLMRYKDEGSLGMDTMPGLARVRTHALDAQTSDSAAATSALLTGVKVRNDVVAMDGATRAIGFAPGRDPIRNVAAAENHCPASNNGAASPTLLELAIAKKRSAGIVTTARLTNGAAAASYAHLCHRDAEYEIARQAVPNGAGYNPRLGKGLDVMMGGGSTYWRPFDASKRPRGRPDARELIGEMQTLGYTIATDLTTMNAAPISAGSRLIGLYDFNEADGAMSFDADRDPKREPSLAEMTAKAIEVLSTNLNGYVLVVEAGRIDQALHAGNARRALVDTIAFDDAVKVALERADLSRTLVIVTGDHDSTLTLIGGGRRSSDVLGLHLNPVTGKPDLDASGSTYTSLVFGTGVNRPDKRVSLDTPTVVQKDYLQESVIKMASGTNGGGDVILRAAGAGTDSFHGTIENTRVFALIRKAADL